MLIVPKKYPANVFKSFGEQAVHFLIYKGE